MKKAFLAIVIVVVLLGVVGVHLDWLRPTVPGHGDAFRVSLTLEPDKLRQVGVRALDGVQHAAERAKEELAAPDELTYHPRQSRHRLDW